MDESNLLTQFGRMPNQKTRFLGRFNVPCVDYFGCFISSPEPGSVGASLTSPNQGTNKISSRMSEGMGERNTNKTYT